MGRGAGRDLEDSGGGAEGGGGEGRSERGGENVPELLPYSGSFNLWLARSMMMGKTTQPNKKSMIENAFWRGLRVKRSQGKKMQGWHACVRTNEILPESGKLVNKCIQTTVNGEEEKEEIKYVERLTHKCLCLCLCLSRGGCTGALVAHHICICSIFSSMDL